MILQLLVWEKWPDLCTTKNSMYMFPDRQKCYHTAELDKNSLNYDWSINFYLLVEGTMVIAWIEHRDLFMEQINLIDIKCLEYA